MIQAYQGNVLDEFMDGVLGPRLRAMSVRAWEQALPVVIVTPSPSKAQMVKVALLAAGIPLLGVEFWQPSELRRQLARALDMSMPLEDNRLVAAGIRSVAQNISTVEPRNGTARALSKSAQSLADTLCMLETAGWDHTQIHAEPLRSIALKFAESLKEQQQVMVGTFDFQLLVKARETKTTKVMAMLSIVGFDGLHWEHWPVLAAASSLADDVMITLPMTFDTSGESDMIWCSSWEQLAGSAILPVENEFVGHEALGRLADHLDFHTHGKLADETSVPAEFIASSSMIEEARNVVLRAARFVAQGANSVGVLVPGPGPIAREITLALERTQIEHYTTVPGYASPVPHSGSWPALLQALSTSTSDDVAVFLRTNGEIPLNFTGERGGLYVADQLDRFAADVLVSDISVLRDLVENVRDEAGRMTPLKTFLKVWPILPANATFGEYLDAVQKFLGELGWLELALGVADARRQQAPALKMPLSSAAACDWLRVSLPARRVFRTEHNANPYAKIQVLTPTDAVGRTWDHLLFVGQVEGAWPPPLKPAGYLGEDAVRILNKHARDLNSEATITGVFGEGMSVVKSDKGYCVGPLDQRLMYVRDLIRLIKSVKGSVTFSAATNDETDGGKIFQPGDFYRRVYLAMTGDNIDASVLQRIAAAIETETRLAAPVARETDTEQMVLAWRARNNTEKLSEFEFTLGGEECTFPVTIPPSSWSRLFDAPAEIFLTHFVGVRAPREISALPVRSAQGIWAHHFLEDAARAAKPGEQAAWIDAAMRSADRFRTEMDVAMKKHGRTVPAWWLSVLAQARTASRHFASEAGRFSEGKYVLTEREIPRGTIRLRSGRSLYCGGRMDILFSTTPVTDDLQFNGGEQSVWDFKTGSDKPLKGAKSIARYEGLQLALYLLALKVRGSGIADAAIIRDGDAWSRQLTDRDLLDAEAEKALEMLAFIQQFGALGWNGPVRDPYSAKCAYPLATLPPIINPKQKFNAAHEA